MANRRLLSLSVLIPMALVQPLLSWAAGPERGSGRLLQQARSAREYGNFSQAAELYSFAIRDLESLGVSDARLASSLVGLGGVRALEGRCSDAAGLLARGIRILQAVPQPDASPLSEAWATLGRAQYCQRQYSAAESSYRNAIEFAGSAQPPRPGQLLEFLVSQGVVFESERKLAEADRAFERAELVLDQNPRIDANQVAVLQNNRGMLLRLLGRGEQSEAAFLQGLAFSAKASVRDRGLEALMDYNLASLYVDRKEFRAAAARFGEALRVMDGGTSLSPRQAGEVLRDYAACQRKLGERKEAANLDSRARALLRSQPDGDSRQVVDVSELRRSK